jgi:hypothetical protein
MKRVRNTALVLMLAAGSLALPCAAQQEVMPDIYDAAPRTSVLVAKHVAKNMAKHETTKATVRPVSHKARAHRAAPQTTNMIMAKAQPKSVAAK